MLYAYFSLYLSTDSLYIKFVAVTWEPYIAAMNVVVYLQMYFISFVNFIFGRANDHYLYLYNLLFALFSTFLSF
jgi:hypothetical protein